METLDYSWVKWKITFVKLYFNPTLFYYFTFMPPVIRMNLATASVFSRASQKNRAPDK